MTADPTEPEERTDAESSALWRASGMGTEFAASIVGMALIGWLIDRWRGTAPWGVGIGVGLGIIGGGLNFFRAAMRLNRDAAARYKAAHRPTGPAPDDDDPR